MPSLFAAYLRVYEPLSAFDREQQHYWRRYVREGRAVALCEGPDRQRTAVIEALGANWRTLPDLPDEAYVLQTGETLVCPWSLRVRVAEAALHARDGMPPVIADAFVPPSFAALARTVLDDWRARSRRLHEQVATWGVPLRWFVFVDARERQLDTGHRRLLRYRTSIAKARRRARRGVEVLRRSVGEDAPITEAFEDGAQWLEDFHPRSVLELDYGGLVDLFGDDQLAAEDSPSLVAAGLAGLARGDADAATEAYETLVERWREVQLRERSN